MSGPVTASDIMSQRSGQPASQATRVEQSRAVAEVQAAFTVAQARPRDPSAARNAIVESCRMKAVAESAFFKFPRGGGNVTGETIHLAVEMARCWGNISYSIAELERDDERGISEMLATATDLETNTSSRTSFIVPHRRDKEGSKPATPLTSMRDIYENNANMGARRLRECIFRVLPTWLIEEARGECYKTLQDGTNEVPLVVRLAEAVAAFEQLGVSKARIEAKLGPVARLTAVDLAALKISYRSIDRREISADDEFPKVGVEETAQAARRIIDQGKANPARVEDQDQGRTGNEDDGKIEGKESEDAPDPRRKVADLIIATSAKVETVIDLGNLRGLRASDIEAMPDDMQAEVKAALDQADARLRGAK